MVDMVDRDAHAAELGQMRVEIAGLLRPYMSMAYRYV